jgi:hypothetical protein
MACFTASGVVKSSKPTSVSSDFIGNTTLGGYMIFLFLNKLLFIFSLQNYKTISKI